MSEGPFVIFFSYSRRDENLQWTLEQTVAGIPGATVWSDTMIPHGEAIHENIERAINQSDCVLVLFTPSAAASPEVREELVRAQIRGIPIIVLKEASVTDAQIPYFLRDRRYLPFDMNALSGRALADEVTKAIRRLVPASKAPANA